MFSKVLVVYFAGALVSALWFPHVNKMEVFQWPMAAVQSASALWSHVQALKPGLSP